MNQPRDETERMTMFGYYAQLAANIIPDERVRLLQDQGYRDVRQVMRELSAWCYANRP